MNNKGTKEQSPEWEIFPLGLLINFNEALIKHGIHRVLNVPRSREEVLK
jgi:hypothetical protein